MSQTRQRNAWSENLPHVLETLLIAMIKRGNTYVLEALLSVLHRALRLLYVTSPPPLRIIALIYAADNGTFDVGLWQINKVNWDSCSGGAAPCDASQSLTCAIDVWKWGGGSFKLWSTCGGCGCC